MPDHKKDRFKSAFHMKISDDLINVRREKIDKALDDLRVAIQTLNTIGERTDDLQLKLDRLANEVADIELKVDEKKKRELRKKLDDYKKEIRGLVASAADKATESPTAASGAARLLVAARMSRLPPKAFVKLATTEMKQNPDVLKELAAMPGGTEALDDVMRQIGEDANKEPLRAFAENAIIARFELEKLDGDLTRKALPRLYDLLRMVPQRHTKDNACLAKIVLNYGDGSGDYRGHTLTLNVNREDQIWRDSHAFDLDDDIPEANRINGDVVVDFDHTTLHEIGHAVDDGLQFMNNRFDLDDYGNWRSEDYTSVAHVALNHPFNGQSFLQQFGGQYSEASLRRFLERAVAGGEMDKDFWVDQRRLADSGITREELLENKNVRQAEQLRLHVKQENIPLNQYWDQLGHIRFALGDPIKDKVGRSVKELMLEDNLSAIDAVNRIMNGFEDTSEVPPDTDWTQMVEHEATQWCGMTHDEALWTKGKAALDLAVNNRVYIKDRSGWYSYGVETRQRGVSKYQFRTPSEWFAEIYAAYYLGRLKETHPDYGWFDAQIHRVA